MERNELKKLAKSVIRFAESSELEVKEIEMDGVVAVLIYNGDCNIISIQLYVQVDKDNEKWDFHEFLVSEI